MLLAANKMKATFWVNVGFRYLTTTKPTQESERELIASTINVRFLFAISCAIVAGRCSKKGGKHVFLADVVRFSSCYPVSESIQRSKRRVEYISTRWLEFKTSNPQAEDVGIYNKMLIDQSWTCTEGMSKIFPLPVTNVLQMQRTWRAR